MTQPTVNSARPAGGAPQGSAYGLVGICILTGLVPFLVLQSLVPVLRNGLDIWMGSILPVIGASGVASAIIFIGIYRRRSWYLGFVFAYGCFVIVAFVVGFCLALAVLFGLIVSTSPDLRFINIVNIIGWLMISPLAWLLLRMLRLRYWQPWTTAPDWEPAEVLPDRPPQTLLTMWLRQRK